jgi:hypothetical protein
LEALTRELKPHITSNDGYEKIIIANPKQPMHNINEIGIYNLVNWLLGEH